ncbi:MAG: hypothetical protein IJC43_06560 [Clostridia bacterium]|nr:hypothetical protein [Clostridia bacterium]
MSKDTTARSGPGPIAAVSAFAEYRDAGPVGGSVSGGVRVADGTAGIAGGSVSGAGPGVAGRDRFRAVCSQGGTVRTVELEISIPGNEPTHVNLNLSSPHELTATDAAEREQFFRARLLPGEDFEVHTRWVADAGRMDILYNQRGVCVLRNLSVADPASLRFAGRILRSMAERGRLFPETAEE